MRAPEFWARDGALPRLLAPAGCALAQLGRLRRALTTPVRLPIPVICVGNVVAGGTGKTPTVLALARHLTTRGERVWCLTRGYGGRSTGPLRVDPVQHDAALVGDEALLLARVAPTVVARDRRAGGRIAVDGGASHLIMDDGFQNPGLAKDLSLIVVDGAVGLGNGRLLPAGPLREPLADGLARAQAALIIGSDACGIGDRLRARVPVFHAHLAPDPSWDALRGRPVLAFAGIGRPTKFFDALRQHGIDVRESVPFADHAPYASPTIEALIARATALGAVVVTTEKDAVRLPTAMRARVTALAVTLAWDDPDIPERLLALLDRR